MVRIIICLSSLTPLLTSSSPPFPCPALPPLLPCSSLVPTQPHPDHPCSSSPSTLACSSSPSTRPCSSPALHPALPSFFSCRESPLLILLSFSSPHSCLLPPPLPPPRSLARRASRRAPNLPRGHLHTRLRFNNHGLPADTFTSFIACILIY